MSSNRLFFLNPEREEKDLEYQAAADQFLKKEYARIDECYKALMSTKPDKESDTFFLQIPEWLGRVCIDNWLDRVITFNEKILEGSSSSLLERAVVDFRLSLLIARKQLTNLNITEDDKISALNSIFEVHDKLLTSISWEIANKKRNIAVEFCRQYYAELDTPSLMSCTIS